MIRLTAQEAADFGEVLVTSWYMIQPIELADGTFILPERILDDLEKFKLEHKYSAKAEEIDLILKVKPRRELTAKEEEDKANL